MTRIVGILALSVSMMAFGQGMPSAPNWDAAVAKQAANAPANADRLDELFRLARDRDLATLNDRLDAIIAGTSLSQPARDAILFRFTVGLAEMEEVDPLLLERLRSVRPTVLVPHEESPSLGVPLFNISGAAEGVRQLGLRRRARAEATGSMDGPPDAWLDAYLRASGVQRRGFVDALNEAPGSALGGLLGASLQRLSGSPDLTPVAGKAALLLADAGSLAEVVRLGGGSELAAILEAAGLTLPADEALALLERAVAQAPPTNAALAIAQLFPRLATDPAAIDLLLAQLPSAELGAGAALALAGAPVARNSLREIAGRDDGPAARRARTALELQARPGGRP